MATIQKGTAIRAPEYFSEDTGPASWSGKHVDELTAKQAIEILVFCEYEARRQGWNSEHHGDKTDQNEFMFHPEFLHGYPHGCWSFYHQVGRTEYQFREDLE
jgi:hypothetical protein